MRYVCTYSWEGTTSQTPPLTKAEAQTAKANLESIDPALNPKVEQYEEPNK